MEPGKWKRVEAGNALRCTCGRGTFGLVLPGSVAYLIPAPREGKPAPGCVSYLCRDARCRKVYWSCTVAAGEIPATVA